MSKEIKSYRKDGNIVIEIPEENLIFGVENNPEESFKVTDPNCFLSYVAKSIITETGFDSDSGLSSFYRLLDEIAQDAAESGEGVESLEEEN